MNSSLTTPPLPSFEAALSEIEEIVRKLESGDISLDMSLELFQRGMMLVDFCAKQLNSTETKLKRLVEGADGEFKTVDAE